MNEEMKERSGSFICATMTYDREDYRKMADCILMRHGKTIPAGHVELVLDKVTSPLVLHLLLLRLLTLSKTDFDAIRRMGDGIDAIHRYLQQVIENSPSDPMCLTKDFLLSAMRNGADAHFASLLLGLLAYCEDGLREEDLRGLCHANKTKWVELHYQEFLELYGY
jgi:hypothetical protein